jgi:predicted nucleotidyltransferase
MPKRVYSIPEIQRLVKPVAERYGVERVCLFGSYARGEATPKSDIDLRIDSGAISDYFALAGFHRELQKDISTSVDVLTTGSLSTDFLRRIQGEEVVLYER